MNVCMYCRYVDMYEEILPVRTPYEYSTPYTHSITQEMRIIVAALK